MKGKKPVIPWAIGISLGLVLILLAIIYIPGNINNNNSNTGQINDGSSDYQPTDAELRNSGFHDYVLIEEVCHKPGSCPGLEKGSVQEIGFREFNNNGLITDDYNEFDRERPNVYSRVEKGETHRISFNNSGLLFELFDGDVCRFSLLFEFD